VKEELKVSEAEKSPLKDVVVPPPPDDDIFGCLMYPILFIVILIICNVMSSLIASKFDGTYGIASPTDEFRPLIQVQDYSQFWYKDPQNDELTLYEVTSMDPPKLSPEVQADHCGNSLNVWVFYKESCSNVMFTATPTYFLWQQIGIRLKAGGNFLRIPLYSELATPTPMDK
jgi:hypothetical protein